MKMEKFKANKYLQILVALLFTCCAQPLLAVESPAYIKTKDWQMDQMSNGKLVLTCKAVFYNPNKAKAKLQDLAFNIWLGETKAGKINQVEKKIRIKKKSAFEIPLRIVIKPETNAWGYIQGVLSALSLQDFLLHIRGYISVKILGVQFKIPIDETVELNLKTLLDS